MSNISPSDHGNLSRPFILALFTYFSLHIALRVFLSGSLDYDEAEQALLSQWLLAGYTEQPPLYTWLQHLLFSVFGKNVFAVSLLKNGLLFLTYVCVFFSAREILNDNRKAVLASLSLLLIPQIGWESQRDMTHTTLVVFAAAATLWQTLRLVKVQSLTNYCILGLLLATGVLAKANFSLFVAVLFLTLCSFPEGRKVVFAREMLLSLLLAAALSGAYLLWMVDNQDIVFSATHKFKRHAEQYWHKGPISLITKVFLFLTPWWLVSLIVFPAGFRGVVLQDNGFHRRFINRYLVVLLAGLSAVVLIGQVTYVKDRWLQPLLFVAPIFFFARLPGSAITPARFKGFVIAAGIAAAAIYIAFTVRVVGVSHTGVFCRLNYPFTTVAENLRNLGFANGLLISDNRFLAGNLHFQFPASTALIPDYRFEMLVDPSQYQKAAVVWHASQSPGIPDDLKVFLEKAFKVQSADYPVHLLEFQYLYGGGETVTLAALIIPLAVLQE